MTWRDRMECEGNIIKPEDIKVGDIIKLVSDSNNDAYVGRFLSLEVKRTHMEIWCHYRKQMVSKDAKIGDINCDDDEFQRFGTYLNSDWHKGIILLKREK